MLGNNSAGIIDILKDRYGSGDFIDDWIKLFEFTLHYEDGLLKLSDDDHSSLSRVADLRSGYGKWNVNSAVLKWSKKYSDIIHTLLWEEADALDVHLMELLVKRDMGDELSWLMEDVIADNVRRTYRLDLKLAILAGQFLVSAYQSLVE